LAAYSIQLEELASHGYVVFGLEHPYDTALIIRPDHRLIPLVDQVPQQAGPPTLAGLQANLKMVVRWAADTKFALDEIETLSRRRDTRFFEHLDLSRVGLFGHSLGGKVAARLCQGDSRVGACMNQDGEIFGIPFGGTVPVSSVTSDQPTSAPFADIYAAEPLASDAQLAAVHVTRRQFEDWRNSKTEALRAFLRRNTQASYLVVAKRPGFTHGSFMDISQLGASVAGTDDPEARSNHELADRLTRAFFDAILKHQGESWNKILRTPPSGITVE
jgi:hypothetical protein